MILEYLSKQILSICRERELKLATVESCTGGLIAATLTDVPGSSDVVECGFVTYSNASKNFLVGVPEQTINQYGAVSKQTAVAMAEGGLTHSRADIAIAVTGIAGPGTSDTKKPIGLVHLAVAKRDTPVLHFEARFGDIGRTEVRRATVERALELILEKLN